MGAVSYIPLGQPFLKTLVSGLMQRYGHDSAGLMDIDILLPTRRAVRAMTDLFLDARNGAPILLPRMRAVADIDDDALEIMVASIVGDMTHLAPALSSLESQLVLAELIRVRDPDMDTARAIALAQGLLEFLKSIRDEGLTLDRLDHLVAAEFAAHWQVTVDFLNILRTVWPQYLTAAQRMDGHDRREALFDQLMMFWRDRPPKHPVIMAGITGSLPHVAALMGVVAGLPQGQVILPGFDPFLPASHRAALDPQHPQYELDRVVRGMGTDPDHIQIWSGVAPENRIINRARGLWMQQVMCPGTCTSEWVNLKENIAPSDISMIEDDLKQIQVIPVETPADEARVIALYVRHALEDPHKHIAIVTPDRALSSAIIAACDRFGIEVNDSAGEVLHTCPPAQFLMLILSLAVRGFTPIDLVGLLRNPIYRRDYFDVPSVYLLEHKFLRGVRPPSEPIEFLRALQAAEISEALCDHIAQLIDILHPLRQICATGGSVADMARVHLQVAEQLSRVVGDDTSAIWMDEDGEVLARLFDDMLSIEIPTRIIGGADYETLIAHLFSSNRVNRRGVGHPRVALLGVYESRLIAADHVILAGFNEGLWPMDPGVDPWLSRGMRRDFGLPPLEQSVGRLAHDVVQLMHAQNVTITYRSKSDGVPALPSRWLHRFYSVLTALFGTGHTLCRNDHIIHVARALDDPDRIGDREKELVTVARPAPRPPVSIRPTQFSATHIETWMVDPYAFYAQKILRLSPLDPIDQEADDRIRGIVLHHVLERIVREDDYGRAHDIIRDTLDAQRVDPALRALMMPRLIQIVKETQAFDMMWRAQGNRPDGVEQTWRYLMNIHDVPYVISARLDRLDRRENGSAVVIDYKTGAALPTYKNIEAGVACQLVVQALCVRDGINVQTNMAFNGSVDGAALWHLKPRGVQAMMMERDDPDRDLNQLCDQAQVGISRLIAAFQHVETPYYPVPDATIDLARSTYDHLSRRKIWWGVS